MGVWASGYIPHTGIRLHGSGTKERRSNPTPNYCSSHSNWYHNPFGEWAAHRRVQALLNVAAHGVVNHSLHFVEPVTGVHTQHVESYWCRVKTKLKRMRGCHAHQLPSYLDEFLWRERFGQTAKDALHNIMMNIAQQYPV